MFALMMTTAGGADDEQILISQPRIELRKIPQIITQLALECISFVLEIWIISSDNGHNNTSRKTRPAQHHRYAYRTTLSCVCVNSEEFSQKSEQFFLQPIQVGRTVTKFSAEGFFS